MAGVIRVTLTLEDSSVRLRAPGADVHAPHREVPAELEAFRGGLRWMRARQAVGDDLPPSLSATPAQVGVLLAERFLPEAVTAALARVIGGCRDAGQTARIGIDCAPRWRDLPWEALPSPGGDLPLALDPMVSLHRVHPRATPPSPSAGPLRILVAISSPGRDGDLDYESELRNVVHATAGARAEVRITRFATTGEIRSALTALAPHVLHLSAHGTPGEIELEDERGDGRLIDAGTFIAEAVPPGSMPPLIVLSACHTNAADPPDQETFAGELIARGAGAVVGTETGITDRYATRVFARLYAGLGADDPDVAGVLHRRLGDIALGDGDAESAREHYTDSRTLLEHLILGIRYRMWGDRFNTAIRRGLAGAHEGLGDLARREGDQAAALVDYGTAVGLLERVVEAEESGKNVHEELATVAAKLAEVALDQGAVELGIRALERAVSSRVTRYRQRAGEPEVTRDLGDALERLAVAAAGTGLTDKALEKIDLAISLRDRARILFDRDGIIYSSGRPADRVALNEEVAAARLTRMRISGVAEPGRAEALALLEPLAATGRLTPGGERTLAELRAWPG